jgi:hypothetical protein
LSKGKIRKYSFKFSFFKRKIDQISRETLVLKSLTLNLCLLASLSNFLYKCTPINAKSALGCLPLWLHHKIGEKKKKVPMDYGHSGAAFNKFL